MDIELEDWEVNELDLHHKGRELRNIVTTEGWQIALDTLQSYVTKANDDLLDIPVGDRTVPTAHAAVSATKQLVENFKRDIMAAVEASYKIPEGMKARLSNTETL